MTYIEEHLRTTRSRLLIVERLLPEGDPRALYRLADLAERVHCAVIVTRFLNKYAGGKAIWVSPWTPGHRLDRVILRPNAIESCDDTIRCPSPWTPGHRINPITPRPDKICDKPVRCPRAPSQIDGLGPTGLGQSHWRAGACVCAPAQCNLLNTLTASG